MQERNTGILQCVHLVGKAAEVATKQGGIDLRWAVSQCPQRGSPVHQKPSLTKKHATAETVATRKLSSLPGCGIASSLFRPSHRKKAAGGMGGLSALARRSRRLAKAAAAVLAKNSRRVSISLSRRSIRRLADSERPSAVFPGASARARAIRLPRRSFQWSAAFAQLGRAPCPSGTAFRNGAPRA